MVSNKLVKPFLKWAGGKRQLADAILAQFPKSFNTYYEPFIGAGAILFERQPKTAIIGDQNEQLCLTYEVVRDNVDELIELLREHAENNSSEYFYQIRELDRDVNKFKAMPRVEKAARMIYLNKTCYNGLYRVNSQGLFNTPYGRYKNPSICEEPVLRAVSFYLRNNDVEIICSDFEKTVETAKQGDFIYFDPPYDSPNCTNFTGYQAGGFDKQEQIRLRDLVLSLSDRNVKCLISNSATDFIKDIYSPEEYNAFSISFVDATRMINSNSEGRGKVQEVLIRNW